MPSLANAGASRSPGRPELESDCHDPESDMSSVQVSSRYGRAGQSQNMPPWRMVRLESGSKNIVEE